MGRLFQVIIGKIIVLKMIKVLKGFRVWKNYWTPVFPLKEKEFLKDLDFMATCLIALVN